MKNKVLNLMSFLLVLLIIFTSYEEKIIKTIPKEKKLMPAYYISYDLGIQKRDELGNPLSDVTFTLKDINNKELTIIPETETPGFYELIGTDDKSLDEILDMFPPTRKAMLKSYKTREDVENSELDMICASDECYLNEVVPFILEETKVPSGYIKEKYYVPGSYIIYYIFDGNEIKYITLNINIVSQIHINFDAMINIDTAFEDFLLGKYDDKLIYNCPMDSSYDERKIEFKTSMANTCPMNLVNRKGTIELVVENFVNNKQQVQTNKNQKLEYTIVIKNNGTSSSTDNIITANIPKGLEYIKDSASHNGEYKEKKHQIEWRIDEIESEETMELTYEAIVPKDANINAEYVSTTSINSREISNEIKSEETKVTLEKTPIKNSITNPNTNSFMNFILLVIPGILVFGMYITTYKKEN